MNSESRNAEDRTIDLYKFRLVCARTFRYYDTSSNAEIAVQPGMPYSSTVSLNADLEVS